MVTHRLAAIRAHTAAIEAARTAYHAEGRCVDGCREHRGKAMRADRDSARYQLRKVRR